MTRKTSKSKSKTKAKANTSEEIETLLEIDNVYDPVPPPYQQGPEPIVVCPNDPKDLAEVYEKVNFYAAGVILSVVKMVEGLSMDGYNLEAAEIGAEVMDKGNMPGVVVFTGIIEEYAKMGRTLDALKAYKRMLASKVTPNSYTYSILIETLAGDADPKFLVVAKKYMLEMMGMGMKPNALTYTAVFKGFAQRGKTEEAKQFLEDMKAKGFEPDEKAVREVLMGRRGPMVRSLFNILFGK
ncbi:pentatricopeptide repeat-containing protein At4g38150-like [Rosa rugosa]|uniref:pentatricopeptide repeat-containing protein At4g38150-like n=1 Tax=Rosa rugosa TaxID=74645 RepID=UPI002B40D52F|nr:pentatricopeptide repeat-containing protein At4g38150-like [Rosa rugosa]